MICSNCLRWPIWNNNPICSHCSYEKAKAEKGKPKKQYKPINKISEKKKEREKALGKVRRELKAKVKACQTCGTTQNLTYSHIIPVSQYPEFESHPENALIQCMSCHHTYEHDREGRLKQSTWPKCLEVILKLKPSYYSKLMMKK